MRIASKYKDKFETLDTIFNGINNKTLKRSNSQGYATNLFLTIGYLAMVVSAAIYLATRVVEFMKYY